MVHVTRNHACLLICNLQKSERPYQLYQGDNYNNVEQIKALSLIYAAALAMSNIIRDIQVRKNTPILTHTHTHTYIYIYIYIYIS